MEIPNRWGEAGLPDFRGMVWFRKTIDVPASWAGKNLVLHLDRIYEGDVTWFNGEQVGATIIANYSKQRVYSIPANLIKTGANTITSLILRIHIRTCSQVLFDDFDVSFIGSLPNIPSGWPVPHNQQGCDC